MGINQHPLVRNMCRVSVFVISNEARGLRGGIGGRKSSQETNWSRALFTVRHRSKGTQLARPEYRLQELGYGKKHPIFYRHELLGPIDVEWLRDGVAKPPPPKDQMADLEADALAETQRQVDDDETADQVKQAIEAPPSANDARFLDAKSKKTFASGALKGIVVIHLVLPAFGPRWEGRRGGGRAVGRRG